MNTLSSVPALLLAALGVSCASHVTDNDRAMPDCCADETTPVAAPAPLPESSIYQLESVWTNQDGVETRLVDFQDEIVVTAMIFTNCQFACPRIVSDLKRMEEQVDPKALPHVRWLLISMDTERDTPEVLKAYAEKNHLPADTWTLLHGVSGDVREVAATLGVNYKKGPNGNYSHSNVITILDGKGQIVYRIEGLNADVGPGVLAINSLASIQL